MTLKLETIFYIVPGCGDVVFFSQNLGISSQKMKSASYFQGRTRISSQTHTYINLVTIYFSIDSHFFYFAKHCSVY